METNGLRDALLRSVFAEDAPVEVSTQATPQAEQRPAEVSAQRSSESTTTPPKTFPADSCQCGAAEVREVGGGFRCMVCGWQRFIINPGSANRKQIEDPEWLELNGKRGQFR
jgi:hypothetical protein